MDKLIEEINALAKKKREQGLSDEEQKRQKELYAVYLKNFRKNFEKQIDNVDVQLPDGTVIPLKEAGIKLKNNNSKNHLN